MAEDLRSKLKTLFSPKKPKNEGNDMKKDEFEKFNETMDKLLAVPHSELQEKLEEEKRLKAKRKKKPTNAADSSRVSSKVVSG